MVVGVIIIVGALALALFIFKDEIANFVSGGLTGAGKSIAEGGEAVQTSIFTAGEEAGRAFAEAEAIKRAEADIEKAAKDSGFESVEAFNKATDSGSIVIGGTKTVVDFGLIGDVIPTNPSPEFIASEEGQALIISNPEFAKIVQGTLSRGESRFGGQR